LSRALVVGELALALILLAGAGLMVRSFMKLYQMSAGMNNDRILTATMFLSGSRYLAPEPRIALLERLEPELAAMPGVDGTALTSNLPLWGAFGWPLEVEGHTLPPDPKDRLTVMGVEVSDQYFQVLGIPILRGRTFVPDEGRDGKNVVIVNRRFVAKHWPGEDPIGKRLRLLMVPGSPGYVPDAEQPWLTVVGEVGDIKQGNQEQTEMDPVVYVPYRQSRQARAFTVVAKSSAGDAHALTVPLRTAVERVNHDLPVRDVLTLPEHFARVRWFSRLFTSLFGIFAVIGLVLASVGIYAVMAYSVTQRTQEIGIRMALGAEQRTILRMIVGRGLLLAAIGVALGLAGSLAATRVMAQADLLVGVTATDPATFAAVALLLTMVALLACYIPARRASRVDPNRALRAE
jgi:predicted permease